MMYFKQHVSLYIIEMQIDFALFKFVERGYNSEFILLSISLSVYVPVF